MYIGVVMDGLKEQKRQTGREKWLSPTHLPTLHPTEVLQHTENMSSSTTLTIDYVILLSFLVFIYQYFCGY